MQTVMRFLLVDSYSPVAYIQQAKDLYTPQFILSIKIVVVADGVGGRIAFLLAGCTRPPAWVVVCWLLNDPATCQCISGTDLLGQFYVLPH